MRNKCGAKNVVFAEEWAQDVIGRQNSKNDPSRPPSYEMQTFACGWRTRDGHGFGAHTGWQDVPSGYGTTKNSVWAGGHRDGSGRGAGMHEVNRRGRPSLPEDS